MLPLSPKAKEGIKRKIIKSSDQNELFDAVVSVQRQLLLFHENKNDMQLLMDRSLAVLAHSRREQLQVTPTHEMPRFLFHIHTLCTRQVRTGLVKHLTPVCVAR